MPRIFLLEDNLDLQATLRRLVEIDGHEVVSATSIADAQNLLTTGAEQQFDLFILDWDLPDGSGADFCRDLRARGGTASILMITGHSLVSDKEDAFDRGADDYLTKPFHLKEFSLRVANLLRRSARPLQGNELVAGELKLARDKMTVQLAGKNVDLTQREFALLDFFMRHRDKVFSAEQLLNHVWTAEEDAAPDTVRTHIKNLRRKLEEKSPEGRGYIETVHAIGYRFVDS